MARLIDADAVLKSMEIVSDKCKTLDETIIAVNMISIVENAPEVDAEPVRRGKWIETEDDVTFDTMYKCSECGEEFMLIDGNPTQNLYNYCPNCGAKMLGGIDNG